MSRLPEILERLDTRAALVVFVAAVDAWAVGLLMRSSGTRRQKWLWSAVIVLCPIVGCVLWYVLGPKPTLEPLERDVA